MIVVGSGEKANELALAALQVRQNAYSPYSKFQVGAALLCEDGTIVKGESIDFRGSCCCATPGQLVLTYLFVSFLNPIIKENLHGYFRTTIIYINNVTIKFIQLIFSPFPRFWDMVPNIARSIGLDFIFIRGTPL